MAPREKQRVGTLRFIMLKRAITAIASCCIAATSMTCSNPAGIITGSDSSTAAFINILLDSSNVTEFELFAPATLRGFYDIYENEPVWTKNNKLTPQATELMETIQTIQYEGLIAGEYHEPEIFAFNSAALTDVDAANIDVLLSDSYCKIATHIKRGRLDRKTLLPYTLIEPDTMLIVSLSKASTGSFYRELTSWQPEHWFYANFKRSIKRLYEGADTLTTEERNSQEVNLLANFEQWRWEYKVFPKDYIFINIPSFTLYFVKNDSIRLTSRVIVGTPEHPTPVLNSIIECFVVYPYWHVPYSIATKELLPKIKKNANFLSAEHFEVLDRKGNLISSETIDWHQYNQKNFPFTLRQREGADNALGILKFVFENPYGVYLHDTNARALFRKEQRYLSHGCIRVEKAEDIAFKLIEADSIRLPKELIERYIKNHVRKEIPVRNPIPIYTRYYTVDQGHFYNDGYKKNEQLRKAMSRDIKLRPRLFNAPPSPALAGQ